MTDMIERVARAMSPYKWDLLQDEPKAWDDFDEGRNYWRGKAIAAIKAMRDPTDEMIMAAKVYRFSDDKYAYKAMIDAALGEHK